MNAGSSIVWKDFRNSLLYGVLFLIALVFRRSLMGRPIMGLRIRVLAMVTMGFVVLAGGVPAFAADEANDPTDETESSSDAQPSQATDAEILFALKVQPVLRSKCLGCHGDAPEELEGGFDVRSRAAMLRGGDSFGETVLVPGDSASSSIYPMVLRDEEGYEMPPKEAERLTESEAWAIRDWIDGGAPWPDAPRVSEIYKEHAEGITWPTSGGLDEKWTNRKYKKDDLWAYQAVVRPHVPKSGNPIDYFIDRKLTEDGIQPAVSADRTTLIRRATFDLTGLPPTPADVQRFTSDGQTDDQAFADLVDRLLESPHYGEQWGRHWLDVVRYADSSGFANDWERPNAWRYRDYVIRAFNDDKPYDQFVREQIAGDEIAAETDKRETDKRETDKRETDKAELLIAAGFLRMGPWEHTGMSVARVTRQLFLDDVTDSVGQVFLAHALQCARCHDHKFDPVPTRDYYAMQAIFATTQFAEVDTDWLSSENQSGMDDDRRFLEMRNAENAAGLAEVTEQKRKAELGWLEERGLPYQSAKEAKQANAPPEHVPPTSTLLSPEVFGRERIGRKWQMRFPWEMDRYKPISFTVYNGKTHFGKHSVRRKKPDDPMRLGEFEETVILTGGDPFAEGESVEAAVLSALGSDADFEMTTKPVGRRTALADWLVSPSNPLTARVMVNRVWQYHFGRGIAGNANNFGATGKKPTHPELLDWLAIEFLDSGWSVKQLHRTIMNSAAYKRSSRHHDYDSLAKLESIESTYAIFHARRLVAEELRDSMLAVSGELNREMGGIPARPDMNLEAALQPRMIMGTFAPSYVPNPLPSQRNRRTVYALKLRGQRDPFMETFNQPGTDKSCELRDNSTVTPQALTMLNSQESYDRALALAFAVLQRTDSDKAAIDQVYQLAYSRAATGEERDAAIQHWKSMTETQETIAHKPRVYPTTIVRRAVEENTGEPFEFTEKLFAYNDYKPDLEAYEVDARVRGLADLCLTIFNSNEFVYVY